MPIPFYLTRFSSGSRHMEAGTSPPIACRSQISRSSCGSGSLGPLAEHYQRANDPRINAYYAKYGLASQCGLRARNSAL